MMKTTILLLAAALTPAAAETWPALDQPAKSVGGGASDAAVVVGVENYAHVPPVPGAKLNASAWYDYFIKTRQIPPENVTALYDADATLEEMRDAVRDSARKVGKDGTLWFVFVGHGAPLPDGKDGLLVGADALPKTKSLRVRSLRRSSLIEALKLSGSKTVVVVLDACFSGRTRDGAPLVPGLQYLRTELRPGALDNRFAFLTAAQGDQFAGPLLGGARPAFSYLVLGGLRGWAETEGGRTITLRTLKRSVEEAMAMTVRGREQTPEIAGREDIVLAFSARERAPDISGIVKSVGDDMKGKAGIVWVSMPGGRFKMGAKGGDKDSRPVHKVNIKAFQIAKHEVTSGQYEECVKAGICSKPSCEAPGPSHPVVCVDWEQAQAFSKWVGGRLPTEAEWEYAARSAGQEVRFPWGDDEATCERANMNYLNRGNGCTSNTTAPVCSKPAGDTEQKLCDMAGNVQEWVQDLYHDSYKGAPSDGVAWESSPGVTRVVRGGSWMSTDKELMSSFRNSFRPEFRSGETGFRPARSR